MTKRTRWVAFSSSIPLVLALGCGETRSSSGGDGGNGSAGSGGDGGRGGGSAGEAGAAGNGATSGTGGSGGDTFEMTCEYGPADNVCDGMDDCPVVEAWQVSCDDDSFGVLGMAVGATSDAVYLGATAWDATRAWRFDDSGSVDVGLPLDLYTSPMAFAVAEDDTLYVVGDETAGFGGDYVGGLEVVRVRGTTSQRSLVFDNDVYINYYDLALDSEGVPHVWFKSDPPEEESLARLRSDGAWDIEPLGHPGDDWERYTLSDRGEVVAFGLEGSSSSSYQLLARYDGSDEPLGSSVARYAPRYRPIDPPVPLQGSDPVLDYAAIVQHPDGLRVAWATDGVANEATLPGSEVPEYACGLGFLGEYPPCAEPCTETASGVEYQAFAATRGPTDVWVAYLIQKSDMDIEYAAQDIDGAMMCVGNFTEDRSTSELVVARVPLDGGEPVAVLEVPMGYIGFGLSTYAEADMPPVAIHAFGNRIAVGARTQTETHSEFAVLLLNAG